MRAGGWLLLALPLQLSAQEQTPASEPSPERLLRATQPETDRGISSYRPVYFLFNCNWRGEGDCGARFQLSLKYRVLTPERPAESNWWDRFYFAYTQTSLWDLQAPSRPFRDSAYQPEMFWESGHFDLQPRYQALTALRLGLGHESNGKDGAASRSINTAFVRPVLSFPAAWPGYVWSFSPRLYAYLDKSDNPDIADYRGYGDYVLELKNEEEWDFTATVRKGNRRDYGSLQLGASYPFRGFLHSLNGYLYLQYFNGYGETILDYNRRRPSQIGIGLTVVR